MSRSANSRSSSSSADDDRFFVESDIVPRLLVVASGAPPRHRGHGAAPITPSALPAQPLSSPLARARSPFKRTKSARRTERASGTHAPPHIEAARRKLAPRGGTSDALMHARGAVADRAKRQVAHVFATMSYSDSDSDSDDGNRPPEQFDAQKKSPPPTTMTDKIESAAAAAAANAANINAACPPNASAALALFGSGFLGRVAARIAAHTERSFAESCTTKKAARAASTKTNDAIVRSAEVAALLDNFALSAVTLFRPDLVDDAASGSVKTSGPDAGALRLLTATAENARTRTLCTRETRLGQMRAAKWAVKNDLKAPKNAAVRVYRRFAPLMASLAAGAVLAVEARCCDDAVLFAAALDPVENGVPHGMALRAASTVGVCCAGTVAVKLQAGADVYNADPWRQKAVRFGVLPRLFGSVCAMSDKQAQKAVGVVQRRSAKRKRSTDATDKTAAKSVKGVKRKQADKDTPQADQIETVLLRGKVLSSPPTVAPKKPPAKKPLAKKPPAQASAAGVLAREWKSATLVPSDDMLHVLGALERALAEPDAYTSTLLAIPLFHNTARIIDAKTGKREKAETVRVNLLSRMFYAAAANAQPAAAEFIADDAVVTTHEIEVNRAARAIDTLAADNKTSIEAASRMRGPVHERVYAHLLFGFLAVVPAVAAAAPAGPLPANALPAGTALRMNARLKKLLKALYVRYCRDTLKLDPAATAKPDGAALFWAARAVLELDDGERALLKALREPGSETHEITRALSEIAVPLGNALFYPRMTQ